MLIVSATSIYFLLYKYEFLTTLSSSNNSDRRTDEPMEIQNVLVHLYRCQFRARIQTIFARWRGRQGMILFSSRVQGPFQKLNTVKLLNLNFPRKGLIPDPPPLNPRMKRTPCTSVSLLLIKTTGHPFSFQNDFLII